VYTETHFEYALKLQNIPLKASGAQDYLVTPAEYQQKSVHNLLRALNSQNMGLLHVSRQDVDVHLRDAGITRGHHEVVSSKRRAGTKEIRFI